MLHPPGWCDDRPVSDVSVCPLQKVPPKPWHLRRKESFAFQWSPGQGTCLACKPGHVGSHPAVTSGTPPELKENKQGPASADGWDFLLISPGTLEATANVSLVDNVGGRKGWGGKGDGGGQGPTGTQLLLEAFFPSPHLSCIGLFSGHPHPRHCFSLHCLLLSISLFVVSFISSSCSLNLSSFLSFSSLSPSPHP